MGASLQLNCYTLFTASLPSTTSATSNPSTPVTPTLAEFEALIDELYTYGVTCDYLINKGITKDRVIGTYATRGYKLPQHYLDRHLEKQRQWGEHQSSLLSQQPVASTSALNPLQPQNHPTVIPKKIIPVDQRAVSPVVTDSARPASLQTTIQQHHRATSSLTDGSTLMRLGPILPTPPTSAPITTTKRRRESQDVTHSLPSNPLLPSASSASSMTAMSEELKALKEELSRKEAAAKEALKARKAALAKQNARRAENFIEGLLSEPKADVEATSSSDSNTTSARPSKVNEGTVPEGSAISQVTPSGSTDLDDYEKVEGSISPVRESSASLPSTVPLSAPMQTRPGSPRRTSSTTFATRPSKLYRPVATDFESDPSHKLSNVPRWTEQLLQSSRRIAENKDMLIDLSDSEDEDDDNDEKMEGIQQKGNDNDNDNDDDTELRLAIKTSRLQDSMNHSGYYQISSFSSTSTTPYPSYSLNNLTRSSESARSSPAPTVVSTVPTLLPPIHSNVIKKPSPPPARPIHSRSFTRSVTPGSAFTPAASIPTTQSTGASNAELQAKQAEIRKMLEKIKQLEGKKKQKRGGNSKANNNVPVTASDSREQSVVQDTFTKGTIATSPGMPLVSISDTERQETIQAARATVDRLLDEVDTTALDDASKVIGGDEQVGENTAMGNLLTVDPVSASRLERRGSSSDEAMSISSGD